MMNNSLAQVATCVMVSAEVVMEADTDQPIERYFTFDIAVTRHAVVTVRDTNRKSAETEALALVANGVADITDEVTITLVDTAIAK